MPGPNPQEREVGDPQIRCAPSTVPELTKTFSLAQLAPLAARKRAALPDGVAVPATQGIIDHGGPFVCRACRLGGGAMTTSTLIAPLLQYFFTEHLCAHKQVSPKTIISYRDSFRLLLRFLQTRTGREPSAGADKRLRFFQGKFGLIG